MCSKWLVVLLCAVASLIGGVGLARNPGDPAQKKAEDERQQKNNQEAKAKKESERSLEQLLAKALRDNPDVRVAEAKVREADAELNRVRQKVVQAVTSTLAEINAQKALIREYTVRVDRERILVAKGNSPQSDLQAAETALAKGRADLAVLEAKLPYLVGQPGKGVPKASNCASCHGEGVVNMFRLDALDVEHFHAFLGAHRTTRPEAKIKESLADTIRRALDKSVKAEFADRQPRQILDWLSEQLSSINIQVNVKIPTDIKVGLKLNAEVPLGAVIQWCEDQFGWRFVIRDYGVVIVERERVPPGAILLHDYWKALSAKDATK